MRIGKVIMSLFFRGVPERCSTKVGFSLTHKFQIMLIRLARLAYWPTASAMKKNVGRLLAIPAKQTKL
jgi:hypothetical protein